MNALRVYTRVYQAAGPTGLKFGRVQPGGSVTPWTEIPLTSSPKGERSDLETRPTPHASNSFRILASPSGPMSFWWRPW